MIRCSVGSLARAVAGVLLLAGPAARAAPGDAARRTPESGPASTAPSVNPDSPISVGLAEGRDDFVACTHRLHAGNRVGYRFHEHTPMVCGTVPKDLASVGVDPAETARLERLFAARPGVFRFEVAVNQHPWVSQHWIFYLAAVEDGIDLLLVVESGSEGLNEFYGIQQCFRMSGRTNEAWRRPIAETPAFSEYDLWDSQKGDSEKTSLTYVLRNGEWQTLPAVAASVGSRTPLGLRIDTLLSGGNLAAMPEVGPYKARMLDPIDCGLITRRSVDGRWLCGIYWDRTSHVTDHHPADCLHSIVNIGGLPPRAKRAIRGKIYWFAGSLDDLRQRWRRDWPAGATSRPF